MQCTGLHLIGACALLCNSGTEGGGLFGDIADDSRGARAPCAGPNFCYCLLAVPWGTSCCLCATVSSLYQSLHLRCLTLCCGAAQVNLKLYKGQTHTSPLIENPMAVSSWPCKCHSCEHELCFACTCTPVSCSGGGRPAF